jgi:hypothetical protein
LLQHEFNIISAASTTSRRRSSRRMRKTTVATWHTCWIIHIRLIALLKPLLKLHSN